MVCATGVSDDKLFFIRLLVTLVVRINECYPGVGIPVISSVQDSKQPKQLCLYNTPSRNTECWLCAAIGLVFGMVSFSHPLPSPSLLFAILVAGFLWTGLEIPEDMDLKTPQWVLTQILKFGQKLLPSSFHRCESFWTKRLNVLPRVMHIGNDWANAWILIFWLPTSHSLLYTTPPPIWVDPTAFGR